ncbi:hypothetical protein HJFPF1_09283 [Paramyrothecium foliicola]|nr:hypothetical protein HJFPF1_09283 [Paramyrothecium foliicola]
MSTMTTVSRALRRTSTKSCLRVVSIHSQQQQLRYFHESTKAKAVEATLPAQHGGLQDMTAPLFMTPPKPTVAQQKQQQLSILAQAYKPEFYDAVAEIMRLRKKYIEDRSIFVESRDMIPLLLGLGARPEDIPRMAEVSDNLYHDPTLPFRRTRNGRFCIDYDTNSLRRLEFQPFTLTVEEDFKRYDSGQVRRFDEIQDNLQLNSVLQALFAFKAIMMHGVTIARRPKLEYGINKWVCTLFNLRTVTTPDILGEPALEGVHSDGVDHTMTTYLGSNNMGPNSAATFMHDMGETTGIQLDEISPKHLLSRVQHKNLLDTLMIVDHERKHSLSPVYPIDKTKEASRDMLVFFTRKPVEKTHVSGSIDSLDAHKELPMEVPLFAPGRL